jgi:preprotein translocase SecF subunit
MKLLRLVPPDTSIEFFRLRHIFLPISAFLSVLSLLVFFSWGVNLGIDFRGGTLIEAQSKVGSADLATLRNRLQALPFGNVEVQAFGSTGTDVALRFETQPEGEEAQQKLIETTRNLLKDTYEIRRIESVGPRISSELVYSGTLGCVLALLGVLIYLWIRFEGALAIGALIATLHDLVLTLGFFAITRLEFNMTSIAAVLTIIGYSLNDTVVVFDRIRELMKQYRKMPYGNLLDRAINSTLSRTLMTSLTTSLATSLAVGALVLFGGEVIKVFSWAMLFGIFVGTYSSIFIASPTLFYLGAHLEKPSSPS